MSIEELKIRRELERDVENDMEEEIKDRIYHLALRLHKLYQHQKQRTLNQSSSDHDQGNAREKLLSEVNINIKLEGGTTIQIKEIKKEARGSTGRLKPVCARKRAQNIGKIAGPTTRPIKFDWERSLRSEASNAMIVSPRSRDKTRDKVIGLIKGGEGGWKY